MSKKNTTKVSRETVVKNARSAGQWVASPEGQRVVESKLARARDISAQFREAERVEPDILHKPVSL
jgi:hypothetical protein